MERSTKEGRIIVMPAFLTHWRVLIETARRSQDAGSDIGSLIIDNSALRRRLSGTSTPPQTTPAGAVWNTGPLPEVDYRFPGSDISAMAYLGALTPDIPDYQKGSFKDKISNSQTSTRLSLTDNHVPWSTLLHTNRSGDFIFAFLEQTATIPSPALRSQALAFMLGHLSHIATDIALNPWINTLANTYRAREIPGLFYPLSPRFYVELCLDEYIAATYFEYPRYQWINQPWRGYIEPAAHDLALTTTITGRVLDVFVTTAESTYGLTTAQCHKLRTQYLAGLQRVRHYLAGSLTFSWLTANARRRKRVGDPIVATIGLHQHQKGTTTLEEVIDYAVRLNERLCRRAISYYSSLRNTSATAEERSQRRLALRNDLRNWDLSTGYTLEVSFEETITLRCLHNWIHFADLWNSDTPSLIQVQQTLI